MECVQISANNMSMQRRVEVAESCVFVMMSSVSCIFPELKSSVGVFCVSLPFLPETKQIPHGVNVTAERPYRALGQAGRCRSREARRTQLGFQEEAARVEWALSYPSETTLFVRPLPGPLGSFSQGLPTFRKMYKIHTDTHRDTLRHSNAGRACDVIKFQSG